MITPLALRKALGRDDWKPPDPVGNQAWLLQRRDNESAILLAIVAIDQGAAEGVVEWVSLAVSHPARWPDPAEVALLRRLVWSDTDWVYEVHPPESDVTPFTRTLWGRADGKSVLPRRVRRG